MSDVVVFSGFNALIADEDRTRFLSTPSVLKRIEEASDILSINLTKYCNGSSAEMYEIENSPLTAALITAIQVGAFEAVQEKIAPQSWLMGCSLGDIARTVCAGSIDFNELIGTYAKFTELATSMGGIGFNAVIISRNAITQEALKKLNDGGMSVSTMSPFFMNVAGSNDAYKELNDIAGAQGWRVQKILDFPAHSQLLVPHLKPFWDVLPKGEVRLPKFRIFSSLTCRELATCSEIQDEVYLNMVTPVRWAEAVDHLIREESVTRMINIGPCESLTKITKRSGHGIEFVNGWELA